MRRSIRLFVAVSVLFSCISLWQGSFNVNLVPTQKADDYYSTYYYAVNPKEESSSSSRSHTTTIDEDDGPSSSNTDSSVRTTWDETWIENATNASSKNAGSAVDIETSNNGTRTNTSSGRVIDDNIDDTDPSSNNLTTNRNGVQVTKANTSSSHNNNNNHNNNGTYMEIETISTPTSGGVTIINDGPSSKKSTTTTTTTTTTTSQNNNNYNNDTSFWSNNNNDNTAAAAVHETNRLVTTNTTTTTKNKYYEQMEYELTTIINITYYIYPEPEIEHLDAKEKLRNGKGRKVFLKRYARDALAELHILDALQEYNNNNNDTNNTNNNNNTNKHNLRVYDPNLADLYIIPTSLGAILTSYGGQTTRVYQAVFQTLLNHPTFKQNNNGHRHVLMALPLPLFFHHARNNMAPHGLSQFYDKLQNVTIVTDNDVEGNRILAREEIESEYAGLYRSNARQVTRSSFSLSLYPTKSVPFRQASMEKFQQSSNLIFYQTSQYNSTNGATPFRMAPVTNSSVIEGLPKSSIGYGLNAEEWQAQFEDSKFCLSIRGDTPHTHSLLRAVKLGCIPVVVADSYPLYAPTLKSSFHDMNDYCIFISEHAFLSDPLGELLKLQDLSDEYIHQKITALAFAQRVLFHDHPASLFIPAFLKEAMRAYDRRDRKFKNVYNK